MIVIIFYESFITKKNVTPSFTRKQGGFVKKRQITCIIMYTKFNSEGALTSCHTDTAGQMVRGLMINNNAF